MYNINLEGRGRNLCAVLFFNRDLVSVSQIMLMTFPQTFRQVVSCQAAHTFI